jgi:hypothetical protein
MPQPKREGDDDDRDNMSHTFYADPPAMRAVLAHVQGRDIETEPPVEATDARD